MSFVVVVAESTLFVNSKLRIRFFVFGVGDTALTPTNPLIPR